MEVNSPVRNAKKQKLSEEWNSDESRNRICNFPEEILLHILSFLPTKDSVRTSILSKRWQYLWMSVSNLEFRETMEEDKRMSFLNSVERVLMLRNPSNIQKFSLFCDVLYDTPRINAWISTALRHKVQVLDLWFHEVYEESILLPRSLFSCESLTVLKLYMFADLILPSAICFRSLKIMTLRNVVFRDDKSTERLFSSCPVLEKLTLYECYWSYSECICISAPMLRSLAIFEFPEYESNCKVSIIGTCLKSFNYRGEFQNDYCFCDSSSLVDAYIDVGEITPIEAEGRLREVADRAHKLLKGLSSIRELTLTNDTVKVLNYAEELLANLPMFYNLTFLKLTSGSVNFSCGALIKLLRNAPSLGTMQCVQGISPTPSGENDDWTLDPVPPCFSTHFKTIEIWDFHGTQRELYVIKSLLKSATALEKMRLTFIGGLKKEYDFSEDMLPSERLNCLSIHNDPKKEL